MNIEQVKKDLDNGIIVSPITYRKLVEAALLMQNYIADISFCDHSQTGVEAGDLLDKVEAL